MKNRNEEQIADPGRAFAGDHPLPETVAAYATGELPDSDEERLRAHLEACEECRDLLLLAPEETAADSGVIDFAKELVWSRLQAEIAREAAETARTKAVDVERRRQRERFFAVAASVMLVVGLAGLYARNDAIVEGLTRPQLNVAIHDVLQMDLKNVRGAGESEPRTFEVPQDTEFFTLVFPVENGGEGPLRVELLGAEGRLIWSERGLEVDRYGFATLGLSRRFLEGGSYRIRVFGESSGAEPLEDHPIEIHYQ